MKLPGRIAQLVTCLAADACLTADPGVASSIPTQFYTFQKIDHEIISTVILLPSAESFKKGCCQLQVKVCAQSRAGEGISEPLSDILYIMLSDELFKYPTTQIESLVLSCR